MGQGESKKRSKGRIRRWSMVYGPAGGTVDFDDPTFVQTRVEFRLPGTYTLMLQASDGEKDANDLTVITVYADPNQNDPPEVYAGSDYSGRREAKIKGEF